MTEPAPQTAAGLLDEVEAVGARVRRNTGPGASHFLITLGVASAGFFLAQPVAGSERGVSAAAVAFAAAVLGAALAVLVSRGTTRHGFSRRFGLTMGAWAAVFAVALAVGTTDPQLAYSWAWWAPFAVLVSVPCLVGAWRELPR